jgi:hypothetical protein
MRPKRQSRIRSKKRLKQLVPREAAAALITREVMTIS